MTSPLIEKSAAAPGATRAAIMRDLRQHAPWALAATVALSFVLVYSLISSRNTGQSMNSGLFQQAALVCFAVLALVCGAGVVWGDLKRGHWAFLVHRPMSRRRLFAAKLFAAAVLYSLPVFVAISVSALFAMRPTFSRAPFAPTMLLPSIKYWAYGLTWLGAGLLVSLRQAHWAGSRFFPLITAGLLVSLVESGWSVTRIADDRVNTFIIVLLTAAMVFSAAGYFISNGRYLSQPAWAKPASFVALLASTALLLMVGNGLAAAGVYMFFAPPDRSRIISDSYELGPGGIPYIHANFSNGTNQELTPDFKALKFDLSDSNYWRSGGQAFLTPTNPFDPDRNRSRQARARMSTGEADASTTLDDGRGTFWSFVPWRRTIEGYNYEGVYTGGIGPNGAYGHDAKPQPFPPTSRLVEWQNFGWTDDHVHHSGAIVASNDTVWVIDPGLGTTQQVFTTTDDGPVLDARLRSGSAQWGTMAGFVLTPRHVYCVGANGPMGQVEIPTVTDTDAMLRAAAFGQDGLSVITEIRPGTRRQPVLVRSTGGKTITTSLPPLPIPISDTPPLVEVVTTLAMPPVALLATDWNWRVHGLVYQYGLPIGLALLVNGTLAVVLSLAVAYRQRLGRRAAVTWGVLSIPFGLAAPLTLLLLREKPARVRCPACGKKRPTDAELCPACGAAWPAAGDPATAVFEGRQAA